MEMGKGHKEATDQVKYNFHNLKVNYLLFN